MTYEFKPQLYVNLMSQKEQEITFEEGFAFISLITQWCF